MSEVVTPPERKKSHKEKRKGSDRPHKSSSRHKSSTSSLTPDEKPKRRSSHSKSKDKSSSKSSRHRSRNAEEVFLDNDFTDEETFIENDAKEKPWQFMTHEQFIQELLSTALSFVGPYVAFCGGEDAELESWKCLNVLRALEWNLGRVEEILDNPEKIFKAAGILEEPKKARSKKSSLTCSVCDESTTLETSSALECQHRFCNECWEGSISSTLDSCTFYQLFDALNCMSRGCPCTILGNLIKKVVPEEKWAQYLRMLVRSYLETNTASYSQCPLASCGKVAKLNLMSKAVSRTVNCECGTSYCFRCTLAPHVPASCSDIEKWKAKDSDDEASLNLIKATTTQCPSCERALDRITACNHITCGCGYQFCFVCRTKWGSCQVYNCSKFTTVEDREKTETAEFAPGFQTASEWLLQHERFVAFTNKVTAIKARKAEVIKMQAALQEKSLAYRDVKPGGNPQFIMDGWEILVKACDIVENTYIWGFFNIPAKICAQKNIFEWQLKNYEKLVYDLYMALKTSVKTIDHMKTKQIYNLIESNLIKEIENAEDLLSLFSEKSIGDLATVSALSRWTCQNPSCNYSNHPVEQQKNCGHCGQARPEVKILWFAD